MSETLQLQVRAINGAGPAEARAEVHTRSLNERLRQSGLIAGAGLLVGLLFLPIPLIHIFGLLAFLGAIAFSLKRFRVRALVRRAEGHCPSCGADARFFVGGGQQAARWPLRTSCGACGIGVILTPAA